MTCRARIYVMTFCWRKEDHQSKIILASSDRISEVVGKLCSQRLSKRGRETLGRWWVKKVKHISPTQNSYDSYRVRRNDDVFLLLPPPPIPFPIISHQSSVSSVISPSLGIGHWSLFGDFRFLFFLLSHHHEGHSLYLSKVRYVW